MAKKKPAKKVSAKSGKKATKKAKPAKKAKAAKKTKAAKKPLKKKAVKKAPRKIKKAAKKALARKSPKKATKKAVKKAAPKNKAKKSVKKVVAKTKKVLVKNTTKKAIKKASPVKKPAPKRIAPPKEVAPSANDATSFEKHKTHLRPGNTAPYFEGTDQHGNTVSLYSLQGKTVILYFYPQDDTDGCTKEACSLRDEFQYLSDNNYAVVGVSPDDIHSHQKFANKYNLPFPLLVDTEKTIIHAYDVWGPKMVAGHVYDGVLRTTFVIDMYGIIKDVVTEVDTANHAKQLLAL